MTAASAWQSRVLSFVFVLTVVPVAGLALAAHLVGQEAWAKAGYTGLVVVLWLTYTATTVKMARRLGRQVTARHNFIRNAVWFQVFLTVLLGGLVACLWWWL